MKYIDMHCDTLMTAWRKGAKTVYELEGTHADVKRLLAGGCKAQFFAIYMPSIDWVPKLGDQYPGDDGYIAALYELYQNTVREHGDTVACAKTVAEIEANDAAGKLSAVLTMEDGRAVLGSMERLEKYYGMGVRALSLTWNHENCFGFPNSRDSAAMAKGLKPFGKDAIVRMNELGMVVDVSHLSDGGFWDVVELSRKPFVATHSNCRVLNPHPRSMTDEMIRALADKGGCMGVNFAPGFLTQDLEQKDSTIEMLVAHLRHMVNTGGIGCAAVGTDFDGIGGDLEINSADKMPQLFIALEKAGFSAGEIEKIACGNVERVLRDAL